MMSYVDQELTVEDMLADPIVQTLMRYDGVSASDVRHTIDQVNQNRPENAVDDLVSTAWATGPDAAKPTTQVADHPRLHDTAA